MWATVLGVHYIIVNVIWFLQKFNFHSHSVYWDAHQRLKLGLGSRSTAVARKCQNINIITKHKHYFQIQIFHKSISYLLESMFKCKIKFEGHHRIFYQGTYNTWLHLYALQCCNGWHFMVRYNNDGVLLYYIILYCIYSILYMIWYYIILLLNGCWQFIVKRLSLNL